MQTPIYLDVRKRLEECINQGNWMPGEAIPSEKDLAKDFGVSLGTVKRAVSELISEGVLFRKPGRGTFIARISKTNVLDNQIRWFESDIPGDPPLVDRLVSVDLIPIPPKQRQIFPIDKQLWKIEAEHWFLGETAVQCFDSIFLSPSRILKMSRQDGELLIKNPYGFYQDRFGVSVRKVKDRARAVFLNKDQCTKAAVPFPYPAIRVERTAFDNSGTPIEFRIRLMLTDSQYLNLDRTPITPSEVDSDNVVG